MTRSARSFLVGPAVSAGSGRTAPRNFRPKRALSAPAALTGCGDHAADDLRARRRRAHHRGARGRRRGVRRPVRPARGRRPAAGSPARARRRRRRPGLRRLREGARRAATRRRARPGLPRLPADDAAPAARGPAPGHGAHPPHRRPGGARPRGCRSTTRSSRSSSTPPPRGRSAPCRSAGRRSCGTWRSRACAPRRWLPCSRSRPTRCRPWPTAPGRACARPTSPSTPRTPRTRPVPGSGTCSAPTSAGPAHRATPTSSRATWPCAGRARRSPSSSRRSTPTCGRSSPPWCWVPGRRRTSMPAGSGAVEAGAAASGGLDRGRDGRPGRGAGGSPPTPAAVVGLVAALVVVGGLLSLTFGTPPTTTCPAAPTLRPSRLRTASPLRPPARTRTPGPRRRHGSRPRARPRPRPARRRRSRALGPPATPSRRSGPPPRHRPRHRATRPTPRRTPRPPTSPSPRALRSRSPTRARTSP